MFDLPPAGGEEGEKLWGDLKIWSSLHVWHGYLIPFVPPQESISETTELTVTENQTSDAKQDIKRFLHLFIDGSLK